MNISEESLKKLEKIVEDEMLSTEEIRESLDVTEKGRIRQSIQNCKYVLEHDPCFEPCLQDFVYKKCKQESVNRKKKTLKVKSTGME